MIEIRSVSKRFGEIKALDQVSATVGEGHVFGLVGTNGAGKSTLMRLIAGVLKPDQGKVLVDGEPVYDNPGAKGKLFYLSDDQYFFKSGTAQDMLRLYGAYYPGFDAGKWRELMGKFGLDSRRKINTFSKGMKKQLSVICGICANTKYLLCDETFDGLDPVMRQAVKAIFIREMEERGLTPVIASHNLRELEDVCDCVGLLHKGGILFEKDLDDMKMNIHKLQCIINGEEMLQGMRECLEILTVERRGSLCALTVRGSREDIEGTMAKIAPVFYEMLPLSLEEIFISETEVKGYDIKALIL